MNDLSPKRLGGIFDTESSTHQAGSIWDKNEIAPTIDTMQGGYRQPMITNKMCIRKLTPTECYKLMGFTEEDCKKASDVGISNTQLYKQAGNSIVVDVLEAIFTSLSENYEEFRSAS